MSKFGDSIKNALQSDTGRAASSAAIGAYTGWLDPKVKDDDGGGGGESITDQPWFLPAVVGGGLLVLFLVMRSR